MKFTYTRQDRAVKKVQIAIDKMIDLSDDFPELSSGERATIGHILDSLRSLENRIYNMGTK